MFSNYFFLVVQICVHVTRTLIPPNGIFLPPPLSSFCPQRLACVELIWALGLPTFICGGRQRLKEANAGTITTGGGLWNRRRRVCEVPGWRIASLRCTFEPMPSEQHEHESEVFSSVSWFHCSSFCSHADAGRARAEGFWCLSRDIWPFYRIFLPSPWQIND